MKYKEIQLGQKAEMSVTILEDDREKYISLSGDNNSIHTENNIVHGMLIGAYVSKFIGTQFPGDGVVIISCYLDFVVPIRWGEKILIKGVVKHKFDPFRQATIDILILDNHDSICISGSVKVKIPE